MRPLTQQEIKKFFGAFAWRNGAGGAIIIDPNWTALNIVRVDMPIVGVVAVHKQVSLDLYRVFTEISQAGLTQHIDVDEFKRNIAGCWVPRHKCWDPSRMLSRHSWGCAIDFNVRQNPYNSPSTQHPGVVEIFEDRGFYWGSRFMIQDGMHFEIGAHWQPLRQVTTRPRP